MTDFLSLVLYIGSEGCTRSGGVGVPCFPFCSSPLSILEEI